jgi:hypothetical protein
MYHIKSLATAIGAAISLTLAAQAQTTNLDYPPPIYTKLEAMEYRTGTIILKAEAPIGTMTTAAGSVSVACKNDQDLGTGLKESGVEIGLTSGSGSYLLRLDYDELDGLLKAIGQLEKVDWTITSLSSFNASYETRDGFRVAVFSSRRSGAIEIAVRSTHANSAPLLLAQAQLMQLQNLIQQAQTRLDGLLK